MSETELTILKFAFVAILSFFIVALVSNTTSRIGRIAESILVFLLLIITAIAIGVLGGILANLFR